MTKRLLLVEDDPAIASLMNELMRLEGFEVLAVSDGYRALEELRRSSFDAAILDVMLPGLDGITILRVIRSDETMSDLPIVMLTAKHDDETTWAGWKAGCNYYLTKPFDPDELVSVLHRIEADAPRGARGPVTGPASI